MERPADRDATAGEPPKLSATNRFLRACYYLLFWWLPYRQLTRKGRRHVRRFYAAVFGLLAVGYAIQGDAFTAVGMFLTMLVSGASLRLVDRALEGGDPVPRTRFNLPADLESKAPERDQPNPR